MTKKQTKEIFDKYNPADKSIRCPNGKASLRKLLDLYAKAAVNLYGIIPRDEFINIFNEQNNEKTTSDEVFSLLLPNVLKGGKWYGFYKDYIVHYSILENFEYADYLEKNQSGKPRYLPSKKEFIKYEIEYYNDNDHWDTVLKLMFDFITNKNGVIEAYEKIKNMYFFYQNINQIGTIMDEYDLEFDDEKNAQLLFDKLMTAMNNTRIWANKGYKPEEMMKLKNNDLPQESLAKTNKKVGVNESCPCGSGKKYKKCCKANENNGSAQLVFDERKLFYETWYKLLDYINQKNKILNYDIKPVYPSNYDESQLHVLREILWNNPKVIGEFVKYKKDLSVEEIALLESWENYHIKGEFILIKYEAEYAVFMKTDKEKPVLYAVKGMTTSISEAMQYKLPVMIETVLLPFKDKIIYDSFIGSHSISFGKGVIDVFNKDYEKIKNMSGITTMLYKKVI